MATTQLQTADEIARQKTIMIPNQLPTAGRCGKLTREYAGWQTESGLRTFINI